MTEIDIRTDMVVAGFDAMRPIFNLRTDIQESMNANVVGDYEVRTGFRRGYFVAFADDGEASAFRLKWG